MDILTICNNCVDNYNNTVHSALHGLTPKQITPETQNSFIVQLRAQLIKRTLKAQLVKRKTKACRSQDLKKKNNRKKRLFIFNVRDKVRISHLKKKKFLRGCQQKWSDEIFTIYKRFFF